MMGERIPHAQLGFHNLEDFIRSEPSLVVREVNGILLVDAKLSEKSSHIVDFVNKQKGAKKKG